MKYSLTQISNMLIAWRINLERDYSLEYYKKSIGKWVVYSTYFDFAVALRVMVKFIDKYIKELEYILKDYSNESRGIMISVEDV